MSNLTEMKSKQTAVVFTLVTHFALLLVFVSIVFVKPEMPEMIVNRVVGDDFASLSVIGFQFVPENSEARRNDLPLSKAEQLVSDPAEINTRLSDEVSSEKVPHDKNEMEFQSALARIPKAASNGKEGLQSGVSTKDGIADNRSGLTEIGTVQLQGRILMTKVETIRSSMEEGKVIVEIVVDETGKVVRANAGKRGSTILNTDLYTQAETASLRMKFNASPEGTKEQLGTCTFLFTLE
ncbi:MAG TPA: hypothetical protein VGC65_08055 [Bacteroidia bacterium]|jgi:hypothetical protein